MTLVGEVVVGVACACCRLILYWAHGDTRDHESTPLSLGSLAKSFSFNCLILGEGPDDVFDVTIPKNGKVAVLKEYIKKKSTPYLDNVPVRLIELWRVSLPIEGLDARVEIISTSLTDDRKLRSPTKKLITTFENHVDDDLVHLIVRVPVAPPIVHSGLSQVLRLTCFISGDSDDQFYIEISKDKNVDLLKDRIKDEWGPRLSHINSPDLSLWQILFPIVDLPSKDPMTRGPKLRPERKLAVCSPRSLTEPYFQAILYFLEATRKSLPLNA
ncbi:hypothetical protein CVT26_005991 [Gymnopilus dilepis]|uniref:Crinkler effector protein N-terminal domain-containing protein n=1 Tax=Gymnopilus dilepis TaxID=231916 RepID=A0A409WFG8_9AGAR|nr:hypothetical protein CVT26_005991 [Gymnopilus dilepis]